jgi:hypothetical protein
MARAGLAAYVVVSSGVPKSKLSLATAHGPVRLGNVCELRLDGVLRSSASCRGALQR